MYPLVCTCLPTRYLPYLSNKDGMASLRSAEGACLSDMSLGHEQELYEKVIYLQLPTYPTSSLLLQVIQGAVSVTYRLEWIHCCVAARSEIIMFHNGLDSHISQSGCFPCLLPRYPSPQHLDLDHVPPDHSFPPAHCSLLVASRVLRLRSFCAWVPIRYFSQS